MSAENKKIDDYICAILACMIIGMVFACPTIISINVLFRTEIPITEETFLGMAFLWFSFSLVFVA